MENLVQFGYVGVFLAGFLAATILPFSSEMVFIALIVAGFNPFWCLICASIGNWLGGLTNYYLGILGKLVWIEKYFKVRHCNILKMQKFLYDKGAWFAFFCFLPMIGELIALALGFMRANQVVVCIAMFLGKFLRYLFLLYGIDYIK